MMRDWSHLFNTESADRADADAQSTVWDMREGARVIAGLYEVLQGCQVEANVPVVPEVCISQVSRCLHRLKRSRMRWFERWCAEHKAVEVLRSHVEVLQGQVAVLQAKLRLVQTDAPNVWQWDGDTKGLEGLTAPVVMPAEALRQLLQEKQAVEEKLQELRAQTAAIARQLAGVPR